VDNVGLIHDMARLYRAELENRETRIETLEKQLTTEREGRERAEADNAALVEEIIRCVSRECSDTCDDSASCPTCNLRDLMDRAQQPHPGAPLREELERLREKLAVAKAGLDWFHDHKCKGCEHRECAGRDWDGKEFVCVFDLPHKAWQAVNSQKGDAE
jgi:aspartyl/asparaginyl-tRNA synthetase